MKPVDSILTKMAIRYTPLDRTEEEVQDIAGLWIMCQSVEDIHQVIALLRNRRDLEIVEERDYIENKKESGYRSHHAVAEYLVQLVTGGKTILAETQIRALSMDFWTVVEHSLNYKYRGVFPKGTKKCLQRVTEVIYLLDGEMSSIREEIREAQHYSPHDHGLLESEYYKQIKDETPENQ